MTSVEPLSGKSLGSDPGITLRWEPCAAREAAARVTVTGYVDAYNSEFFFRQLKGLAAAGYRHLVLEAADLTYLSSTGVGALVQLFRNVRPLGGAVVLVALQPRVREVLSLLGFEPFFPLADSVEEALAALDRGGPPAETFPLTFHCPICSRKLKTHRHGRFRCGECRTILAVTPQGQVSLG